MEKNYTMCKWYVGTWEGECRRFPPYHTTNFDNRYPSVSKFTEVCGEFQPKERKERKNKFWNKPNENITG